MEVIQIAPFTAIGIGTLNPKTSKHEGTDNHQIHAIRKHVVIAIIVGKVENGRGIFVAGGKTNEFLQFKLDLICLPMSYRIVVSVSDCVDHYKINAKLSGTNLEIGISFNRLLIKPLSTGLSNWQSWKSLPKSLLPA